MCPISSKGHRGRMLGKRCAGQASRQMPGCSVLEGFTGVRVVCLVRAGCETDRMALPQSGRAPCVSGFCRACRSLPRDCMSLEALRVVGSLGRVPRGCNTSHATRWLSPAFGALRTNRSSCSQPAPALGEGSSALTQLSSPSFPMGHASRFSHCLSARAAYFPGEFYLPAGEVSSQLPGQLKALLPLQPVSGCVPGARRQREPRPTPGAPDPTCGPGTLFAKSA